MPASRAVTGNKATLSIGSAASPLGINPMLEIKSFSVTFAEVPEVTVTHLLSPDSTEEFRPGLIKPSAIEATGNFIGDSSQLAILPMVEAQTILAWQIQAPVDYSSGIPSKTYTAHGIGYIKTYGVGPFEQNKALDVKVSIQISGTMTEATT